MTEFRCLLVSWNDIETWTKDVISKLKKDGFNPDFIIGLARGGLVPARLVSDILQVKDLYVVKTEHWGITATKDGEAKLIQKLPVSVKGKNVLVVDDITDTGKSLKLALEHIQAFKPSKLKSATLLHITHSSIKPNYYSQEINEKNWTWFIFPWNVYEDLRTIVPKTLEEGSRKKMEIKNLLFKNFYITVNLKTLNIILDDLQKRGIITKQRDKYSLTKNKRRIHQKS